MLREFLGFTPAQKIMAVSGVASSMLYILCLLWVMFWLYGVGLVPLGLPAIGFWQFCAIVLFVGYVVKFFKGSSNK